MIEKDNIHSMFSSKKSDWETPDWLFQSMNERFGFTLDVCATKANAKCDKFFTVKENALLQSWANEICWMNPPYGREISKWVEKAYLESKKAIIVGLLPVRTDTKWFHSFVYRKAKLEFLNKRLRFKNAGNMAPFSSMIVVWGKKK